MKIAPLKEGGLLLGPLTSFLISKYNRTYIQVT